MNIKPKVLAKLSAELGETVREMQIVDGYIQGNYTSIVTGSECVALFTIDGKLIKKGITEVLKFNTNLDQFILRLSANEEGHTEFKRSYSDNPDFLYCVVDSWGKYIIEPQNKAIELIEGHGIYLIDEATLHDGENYLGKKLDKEFFDDYDAILFRKDGKIGLIEKGKVIIEPKYKRIERAHHPSMFWVIEDGLKVNMLNVSNGKCGEWPFDSIRSFETIQYVTQNSVIDWEDLKILEDVYLVEKNGKKGLANSQGEIILPIIYEELHHDRFPVEKNGVEYDWLCAKINDSKYVLGNVLLNADKNFELIGGPLLFCKAIGQTYLTLTQKEIRLLRTAIDNTSADEIIESFKIHSSADPQVISDMIRKINYVFEEDFRKVTFEFWYIEEEESDIIYLDASCKVEKLISVQ